MPGLRLPLAVTQGDPAGVGPEITLKAWREARANLPAFFVLGDPDVYRRAARLSGVETSIRIVDPADAMATFPHALPIAPLVNKTRAGPGAPDPFDAAATIESIERAAQLVHSSAAAAMVTNPISKESLYRAGFAHPGHTEFLGELTQRLYATAARPVMLLWSAELAVVPLTIHLPLAQVFELISAALIRDVVHTIVADYDRRFGLANPRIAVSGLNPHAGEGGTMGREEIDVIAPAIADLRREGLAVAGPLPADTMFHAAARKTYDVALCMYHDQALIPIKTLAFESAVNVTLGLPFVRTSPDHGTAFDIAGRGMARSASLEAALRLAARLSADGADRTQQPAAIAL